MKHSYKDKQRGSSGSLRQEENKVEDVPQLWWSRGKRRPAVPSATIPSGCALISLISGRGPTAASCTLRTGAHSRLVHAQDGGLDQSLARLLFLTGSVWDWIIVGFQ